MIRCSAFAASGDVTYSAGGLKGGEHDNSWLSKNVNSLGADVEGVLGASSCALLQRLFKSPAKADGGAKKGGKAIQSVSREFIKNLDELIQTLGATAVQFVRCIKPNMEKVPRIANGRLVLSQLRCAGTMEAVEVMQSAFPTRIPYSVLHERVADALPPHLRALSRRDFIDCVMQAMEVPPSKYTLGKTKLFVKVGVGQLLEELVEKDAKAMLAALLSRIERARERTAAARTVTCAFLTYHLRRRFLRNQKLVRKMQNKRQGNLRRKNLRRLVATAQAVFNEQVPLGKTPRLCCAPASGVVFTRASNGRRPRRRPPRRPPRGGGPRCVGRQRRSPCWPRRRSRAPSRRAARRRASVSRRRSA